MAAVKTRTGTRLSLAMAGEGDSAKTVSVSRIRNDASADELYSAGEAMGDLAENALSGVTVRETYALTEGE